MVTLARPSTAAGLVGRVNSSLNIPTRPNTSRQNSWNYATILGDRWSRSSIRQPQGVALIQRLLSHFSPAAILRAIRPVVVAPFNAKIVSITCSNRPLLEGGIVRPFVANSNAAPAVVEIASIFGVVAPCSHGAPNPVQSSAIIPMARRPLSDGLPVVATTRHGIASPDTSPEDDTIGPALANRVPSCRAVLRSRPVDDFPTAEHFSGHIYEGFFHAAA